MSGKDARTGADATPAPDDSEEKDVKIPVEDAEAPETAPQDAELTEEELEELAKQAGEQAAAEDFKLKFEAASAELVEVRSQLDEAAEAQAAAEARAAEAEGRMGRLQADWENFRRRTAKERLEESARATEKLVCALFPVVDDMERAIDHARAQEMDDAMRQFVDGVDAVRVKLVGVFEREGVEAIDPAGAAFDPNIHQAVGRVEDALQYDETVNDVYQKGYRMSGKVLRPAMVTVTYGGEKRPAPEPEADAEDQAQE